MDAEQAGPEVAREEPNSFKTPSLKRRLLLGGAWAIGGRLVAALTVFASSFLLARLLSPQDLGAYFLALSIVTVGSMLGSLGLDQVVVRFVPESVGLNQFERARRVLGRVLVLGVLGALGVGTTYLLFSRIVGNYLFHAPALVAVAGPVAGWTVVTTLQVLLSGVFRALHDIRLYSVFYNASGVLLTAFLVGLWLLRYQPTLTVVLLLAASSGLACTILAGWLLQRKVASFPSRGAAGQAVEFGEIVRVALPLLVADATLFALSQADVWILGAFRSPEEVAIYGAAARAVLVISIPILAVQSVMQPLIAEMYTQGRKRELERALRAATTVAGVPAFFVVAGFLLLGGPILGLTFGDYYRQGATVMALLSLAQLISVWSGVCGITLAMTGHQTTMMLITIVGSFVTVAAGLAVVSSYGTTGVAVAAAAGVTVTNLAYWLAARRKSGIWTHASFSGFSDLVRTIKRTTR